MAKKDPKNGKKGILSANQPAIQYVLQLVKYSCVTQMMMTDKSL